MDNVRFVCAQPATLYYAWQVEVMINNFIEMGISPEKIDIVCWKPEDRLSEEWLKLKTGYGARFFFYNDTRKNKGYVSSIRPNILKQHWDIHPELKNQIIFYHDCDILFTRPPKEWLCCNIVNDDKWYGSDTRWYIGHDYILSKGEDVLDKMCDIVGISKQLVKYNETNSIGAQYIMKNVDYEFWENVEKDCERLFTEITDLNNEKVQLDRRTMPPGESREPYHPLQIWCADMWAVLWNAWKLAHNTIATPLMNFSWATGGLEEYNECSIYHNAGVTENNKDLFYKSKYINKLPYGDILDVRESSGSSMYWKAVQKTAQKSVLLDNQNIQTIIQDPIIPQINPIKKAFQDNKIHQLQLDPFGVCNAKCWFCPVKYNTEHNAGREVMSPELLEKIISNLIEERDKPNGLVSPNFGGFYTAHYNEILLYPHFEELLQICQKYKLCFMVLSNGMPLTPKKVDLINKYKGVVNGICLNIPGFDAETWSKRSGNSINNYDKIISNLNYAINNLPDMVLNKSFSIQVNGANENSFKDKGGWLTKGVDFPDDMDLDVENGELATQTKLAKEMFPNVQIFSVPSLIDRAGLLDHVMTNKDAIKQNLQKNNEGKKVIGCGNGIEVGGRPVGWLHVNGSGEAFLCCNDYHMEVVVGNFKEQQLSDFWGKEDHIIKIQESYDSICRNCAAAIYEN
jgi:hypothetical protein